MIHLFKTDLFWSMGSSFNTLHHEQWKTFWKIVTCSTFSIKISKLHKRSWEKRKYFFFFTSFSSFTIWPGGNSDCFMYYKTEHSLSSSDGRVLAALQFRLKSRGDPEYHARAETTEKSYYYISLKSPFKSPLHSQQ